MHSQSPHWYLLTDVEKKTAPAVARAVFVSCDRCYGVTDAALSGLGAATGAGGVAGVCAGAGCACAG